MRKMFAELDKIALTTAIPLESIFDVPSQSPLWESPIARAPPPLFVHVTPPAGGDITAPATSRPAPRACGEEVDALHPQKRQTTGSARMRRRGRVAAPNRALQTRDLQVAVEATDRAPARAPPIRASAGVCPPRSPPSGQCLKALTQSEQRQRTTGPYPRRGLSRTCPPFRARCEE